VDDSTTRISRGPVAGRLCGKIAMITGAGSGLGQNLAELFAHAGATVVGGDINSSGVEATAAMADKQGLSIEMSQVDASDESSVSEWVSHSIQRYGGVDILVNNAARTHIASIGEMTLEQWRETMQGELDIVFVPTHAIWRHMIARGGGSIINMGSVAGMQSSEHLGMSAHAAGKGGVIAFTRQLAHEGAPHWIRANSLSPGPILTPVTQPYLEANPEFRRVFEGWPLLARTGRPADVSYAGLFLASDESAFVTGSNLVVDGGWLSKGGFTAHQNRAV